MIKNDENVVIRAIALCYKPFLKVEEALIYCNLGRTQFSKRCEEFGIYKNESGYFRREHLDKLMSGEPSPYVAADHGLRSRGKR
ncbi:DNA-binding protein [Chitinophaga sp. 180180018-2]|nr:DNA-binding protein [Chitinophaga sp. 212800010-3]